MKPDEYLVLSRRSILIIPALVLAVLLHNVIYGLFHEHYGRAGGDEAVFMILVPVILLYFIISLVYTVIRKVGKRLRNRPVEIVVYQQRVRVVVFTLK